jgi:hypothetical protein
MPSPVQKLCTLFGRLTPLFCFIVVAVGLLITTALGRPDLAIKVLYLVIPVVLALIIARKSLLGKVDVFGDTPTFNLSRTSFSLTIAFFIAFFIASLSFLIRTDTRPVAYHVTIALMAGLIIIQILGVKAKATSQHYIILTEIVLLSMNIVFGQTLKFPLYFGGTDVLDHMDFMNSLVLNGKVTPTFGIYQDFPLFHLFGASGMLVMGMDVKTTYFALTGLLSILFIILTYLFASISTGNHSLSLSAALLFMLSRSALANSV